jgi:hypothetical protein
MEHTLSDNHVGFCDIFLLWNRLYLTIMLESCWLVSSIEQTLSKNHIGFFSCMEHTGSDNQVGFCDMILLWNRLYLTIMLDSVKYFFYGADSIWQSC